MLDPEFKRNITRGIEKITWELQDELIKVLVKELTENETFSQTTILKLLQANEAGILYKKIIPIVAKTTKKSQREIKQAFEKAKIKQAEYDAEIYGHKVKLSVPMAAIIQAQYEMTMGEFRNYTRSTAQAACKSYFAALDRAYNQTVGGLKSWNQAFMDAVDEIGAGVKITYDSGYKTSPEVAVARSLRTGIAQMASQITATRAVQNDVHLFLTSAHDGARPTHEPWQGQVFWVDWKELARRIPVDLPDEIPEATDEEKKKYKEFCVTTEIGDVQGLEGANCRHSYGPFFEGSTNPYEGKVYDQSKYDKEQKARAMERNIRKWKQKYTGQKTAYDNMSKGTLKDQEKVRMEATRQKLNDKIKAYYDYCNANEIKTPQEFRLYISK